MRYIIALVLMVAFVFAIRELRMQPPVASINFEMTELHPATSLDVVAVDDEDDLVMAGAQIPPGILADEDALNIEKLNQTVNIVVAHKGFKVLTGLCVTMSHKVRSYKNI